jgi:hypothetical protein
MPTSVSTSTYVNSNITFTDVHTIVTLVGITTSNTHTVTDSAGNTLGTNVPDSQFNQDQLFIIGALGGTYITAPGVSNTYTWAFNIGSLAQTFVVGGTATMQSGVAGLSDITVISDGGDVINTTLASVATVFNVALEHNGTYADQNVLFNGLNVNNVTFTPTGGTLDVGSGTTFISFFGGVNITGFDTVLNTGNYNSIDDETVPYSAADTYTLNGLPGSDQQLLIHTSAGTQTIDLGVEHFTNISEFTFSQDTDGSLLITVCFLRGTHIATPEGETRVEDLRIGDLVATRADGETVFHPVTWLGNRKVEVSRCQNPQDSYPVRIRANAFGDNVPHRDLLLTPEHCIFIDGKLIPVRMLVNGRSIIVDTSIGAYEYFHVELENHAILLSEGLETESYLDTGNRGNFANAAVPSMRASFATNPTHKSWEDDAVAPLVVDRAVVEPIWDGLTQRALELGVPAVAAERTLTRDPDLHLVTEAGWKIRPALVAGNVYTFAIPGGTQELRLVSRASRPSDTVGPFLDDRRNLGVLVGKVALSSGRRPVAVDAHLSTDELSGWYAQETDFCRWTNGNAAIKVDLSAYEGRPTFLDIEVLNAGPYLADAETAAVAIAA